MHRGFEDGVAHLAIIHQAALGDTVLLLPLIRSLRQRFGGCRLTIVTKTNLGQMLEMLGLVDAYTSADDREHSAWFREPEAAGEPNSRPAWADADLVISAVSSGVDAWAHNARLARAGTSVGEALGGAPGLLFFEPRPPADFAGHVCAWHRQQLAAGGLSLPEPELPLPRSNPDGAMLIHPGSGGDAKCWPRERFVELGRSLKRNGILPTFILGEVEQERWGTQAVAELQQEFSWYLHMGLYELAERMSRARMFVGNDSGVTHLAAAMGIPVLALFGPSNDVQWRPVGPGVRVLRAAAPHERELEELEGAAVLGEVLAELRKL